MFLQVLEDLLKIASVFFKAQGIFCKKLTVNTYMHKKEPNLKAVILVPAVSNLGPIQNPAGQDPEQIALADPALSSCVGLDNLQRSFPVSLVLWNRQRHFLDSVPQTLVVSLLLNLSPPIFTIHPFVTLTTSGTLLTTGHCLCLLSVPPFILHSKGTSY